MLTVDAGIQRWKSTLNVKIRIRARSLESRVWIRELRLQCWTEKEKVSRTQLTEASG